MEHIKEHILELYTLGSSTIQPQRAEIEAHLRVCAGCRTMVEEMTAFYAECWNETEALRKAETPGTDLVPVHLSRDLMRRDMRISVRAGSTPPVRSLRSFIARHPVSSGIGAFSFGAAAVAALVFLVTSVPKDTNPSYIHYNKSQEIVEIRNARNEKLWEFPSWGLNEVLELETSLRYATSAIVDLDGDGRNELLTLVPMGSERTGNYLRAFDEHQALVFQKDFAASFQYRDRRYNPEFAPSVLLVRPGMQDRATEFFVIAKNVGRSPSYVARFDGAGRELGRFWHFGHLANAFLADLGEDGRKQMVLTGINDTGDTASVNAPVEFPAIVVLDPEKLMGDAKSASAPGFVMPFSVAEDYYIRLPLSDIEMALKNQSMALSMTTEGKDILNFRVETEWTYEGLASQFCYYFDRTMAVREVKPTNMTVTLHERLAAQGKLSGRIDKAYLQRLKDGVRYWNGREWVKDPMRVNHALIPQ